MIGNFANNRTLRYVVGENITDFQIGYTFNEGAYKGTGPAATDQQSDRCGIPDLWRHTRQALRIHQVRSHHAAGVNYKF